MQLCVAIPITHTSLISRQYYIPSQFNFFFLNVFTLVILSNFKPHVYINNIRKFSSHLTENTLSFHYEDQTGSTQPREPREVN